MVFSSLIFSFLFLPIVIIVYYISKEQYRNYILVIASLLFYSYGEPRYVFLMLFSIIMNYSFGLWIDKARSGGRPKAARNLLAADVVVNISLLFVFKYLNYSVLLFNSVTGTDIPDPGIRLPIGISFFTFQAMSYCIDVYRKKVDVQKNLLYVALYISFFPQLIAGPIVRYSTIESEILSRKAGREDLAEGIRRFLLGFSKKIILANNLAVVAEKVFALDPADSNPVFLWIGSLAYTMQIFYDFSGYSDMAIGLGRMFGFHFNENFNYPYISGSITEFWRRWHISLGTWFRDYVYIPLGGSRVPIPRNILNLFIVWLLTGIWHGANLTFVAWGLFYFVLLVIEKWLIKPDKRRSKIVSVPWRIITLLSVNFAWVMFNSASLQSGMAYIKGMLGLYGQKWLMDPAVTTTLRENGFFIVTGIICCTPVISMIVNRFENNPRNRIRTGAGIAVPVVYCFLFLWSVSFLILGFHNPFIYFNF